MTVKNEALLPLFAEATAPPAPYVGRLTARRAGGAPPSGPAAKASCGPRPRPPLVG